MNLALVVQVLNAEKKFTADDGNMCLAKIGGFQLYCLLADKKATISMYSKLTKSKQEPPPRYSMIIHSL